VCAWGGNGDVDLIQLECFAMGRCACCVVYSRDLVVRRISSTGGVLSRNS
jgi:hypothetical protein